MSQRASIQDRYDDWANDPLSWALAADRLLVSSRLLSEHFPHYRGEEALRNTPADAAEYMIFPCIAMLRAMALECLLKGAWVLHGGSLAKGGAYRTIPNTKDHELRTLADALERQNITTFTQEERRFLQRLSLFIISGRYPVHKYATSPRPDPAVDGIKMRKGESADYWLFPQDDERFQSLLGKLQALYEPSNT